jgi:hypothetical protein
MQERRRSPRMRMLKSGKIFLGSRGVPCTIRSISNTGACLQVQTTYGIPSIFEPAIADGERRACKIVWLDSTRLGVQFQ